MYVREYERTGDRVMWSIATTRMAMKTIDLMCVYVCLSVYVCTVDLRQAVPESEIYGQGWVGGGEREGDLFVREGRVRSCPGPC